MQKNNFYYTSNNLSYKIYFNNIQLHFKKCQIIKIQDYLELKTKDLEEEMKINFYGTIYISLKLDDFIKFKSLINQIILDANRNGSLFSSSQILN